MFKLTLLKFLVLLAGHHLSWRLVQAASGGFYERPGITASEIIKQRGYNVENTFVTSKDGYILNVVHATNPIFAGRMARKPPILFLHGILEDATTFVINSFNVSPKDFSSLDLFNTTVESEIVLDPSAKSLPFLALNFGHEVWLVNRRGAPGSQRKVSSGGGQWQQFVASPSGNPFSRANNNEPSGNWPINWGAITSAFGAFLDYGKLLELFPFSFDRNFWNFSLDEQAEFDFPMLVNYVSEQSGGAKVAVVAHSAGGAIALMALADYPDLAGNISSAILWSQGFSLGFDETFEIFQPALPIFQAYIGSIPPSFSSTQIQAFLGLVCATEIAQSTLCEGILDLFTGASGGKERLRPEFLNSVFYSTSSHELAQNLQCVRFGGTMHHYDYGSADLNMAKYRKPEPPMYDLTRVTLDKISFYVGRTDFIVSEKDVRYSASMLVVPHEFHLIDTTFNHQGYFYHDDTATLAILPSLKEIQRFDSMK